MPDIYTLTFINNSNNIGNFCCYQRDPNITDPKVMSLAWYVFRTAPTTSAKFSWTIDYQFVWSQVGKLGPGVLFNASQKWDAPLTGNNGVDFTNSDGAFTFSNPAHFGQNGTLYIAQDTTIPAGKAAVGINMGIAGSPTGAGSGTFVVAAQPNLVANFTPKPTYWVTFGNYVTGQVLDIGQITQSAQVSFPPNVYSMYAVLNQDNTWTITDEVTLNEAFLTSDPSVPHALQTDIKLLA